MTGTLSARGRRGAGHLITFWMENGMAEIDVRPRRPGLRPWLIGIAALAAAALLAFWLLDDRGDRETLEGVSYAAPEARPVS